MFETPILLITFNRPKHTEVVLTEIKKQRPKKLYVFQDGPRGNVQGDLIKCKEVRELINREVNWKCTLKTLYENENLGCGYGPVKAITWLFENEEQGIILEDDCLPSIDFFRFCEELLNKYKNDKRVWMVSGMNRMGRWKPNCSSYIFTRYGNTWGWASYRRAWNYFDHNMTTWFTGDGKEKIKKIVGEKIYQVYANDFNIHCTSDRRKDVWDYFWHYARIYYSGLAIVPTVNLVVNIGYDTEGTHTLKTYKSVSLLKTYNLCFPLKNKLMKIDRIFEWAIFNQFENPNKINIIKKIMYKTIRLLFSYI
jgi:hypothetical protein